MLKRWFSKCKDELLNCFSSGKNEEKQEVLDETVTEEMIEDIEKRRDEIEEFKLNNIVFDKLNYLEQYIKIFSLPFPKEYQQYLVTIEELRNDYQKELEEYKKGLAGNITFSIDPEKESRRYVETVKLEDCIKKFVENEVIYKQYKDKFSKLCSRLNIFYNAIIDTELEMKIVSNQLTNACDTLRSIVSDVRDEEFFENDSRKREEILNYIIYCEYIIFKSFLRCSKISNFDEYKHELSECYSFFVNEEYDRLIFKFLIEDLEQLQIFISDNLKNETTYQFVLGNCQKLQDDLDEHTKIFDDNEYFSKIIKFENTINNLVNVAKIKFCIDIPKILDLHENSKEIVSVNSIALAILRLMNNKKAELLIGIISRFDKEISWREFYFICKIFEYHSELVEMADNTIFSIIKDKFLKFDNKYSEYTDSYIMQKKRKILNYSGDKSKKYILLIISTLDNLEEITAILESLYLDFVVVNNEVYLNHSYFNGFKNLEENFGAYKTF